MQAASEGPLRNSENTSRTVQGVKASQESVDRDSCWGYNSAADKERTKTSVSSAGEQGEMTNCSPVGDNEGLHIGVVVFSCGVFLPLPVMGADPSLLHGHTLIFWSVLKGGTVRKRKFNFLGLQQKDRELSNFLQGNDWSALVLLGFFPSGGTVVCICVLNASPAFGMESHWLCGSHAGGRMYLHFSERMM